MDRETAAGLCLRRRVERLTVVKLGSEEMRAALLSSREGLTFNLTQTVAGLLHAPPAKEQRGEGVQMECMARGLMNNRLQYKDLVGE